jgi:hypothetical protein
MVFLASFSIIKPVKKIFYGIFSSEKKLSLAFEKFEEQQSQEIYVSSGGQFASYDLDEDFDIDEHLTISECHYFTAVDKEIFKFHCDKNDYVFIDKESGWLAKLTYLTDMSRKKFSHIKLKLNKFVGSTHEECDWASLKETHLDLLEQHRSEMFKNDNIYAVKMLIKIGNNEINNIVIATHSQMLKLKYVDSEFDPEGCGTSNCGGCLGCSHLEIKFVGSRILKSQQIELANFCSGKMTIKDIFEFVDRN